MTPATQLEGKRALKVRVEAVILPPSTKECMFELFKKNKLFVLGR
jgi:hypothetical protein